MIKTPPYLRKGDTIGMVAPVRKISREELMPSVTLLECYGFNVLLGENIFGEYNQFSGTDEERAADFMQMVNNPEVKAILSARGGYGSVRILDYLDFDSIKQHLKWFCGYSDTTVIHALYNKLGVQSLHSTMPVNFPQNCEINESVSSLIATLEGSKLAIEIPSHPLNRAGSVRGRLIGGNLSLIYSLIGTPYALDTKGCILFFEDLDEYLYHIDRMAISLLQSNALENLAGVVVGYMSDMHDNAIPFGKNAEEIIYEHVKKLGKPLAFGLPVGHSEPNYTLKFGAEYELNISQEKTTLVEL